MNISKFIAELIETGLSEHELNQVINCYSILTINEKEIKTLPKRDGVFYAVLSGYGLQMTQYTDLLSTCSSPYFKHMTLPSTLLTVKALVDSEIIALTPSKIDNESLRRKVIISLYKSQVAMLEATRAVASLRTVLEKKEHIILMLLFIFVPLKKYGYTSINISIQDASLLTGVSRQHYSRIADELKKEGIIKRYYAQIEILDIKKLAAQLDPYVTAFLNTLAAKVDPDVAAFFKTVVA
ncbi:Crp/Fnr family transcriptional regulator [Shewanella sp. A14]